MLSKISFLLALSASASVFASSITMTTSDKPARAGVSTSCGFRLVARTTDPFYEVAGDVEGTILEAYHDGANHCVPILRKPDAKSPGNVFYFDKPPQNQSLSLLTDSVASIANGAGPAISYGFSVQPSTESIVSTYPPEQGVSFQAGGANSSTPVSLADYHIPTRGLFIVNEQAGGGTFIACKRPIPYYSQRKMITVEYIYSNVPTPDTGNTVPFGCAPIRLVPICANLPAVPPGSLATHDYVQPTICYTTINGTP
ncbi:MAG: hypothetical protein STHCBS139747_006392 [Sporothrix thermara]